MAKSKMKQEVIPKFSSEAEEAAWWDAHHSEIVDEVRRRIRQKQPLMLSSLIQGAKPSQPITLRIAKEDLETARRLAARQGLGYQTYIKMLLRGALAKQAAMLGSEFSSTGKKQVRANGRKVGGLRSGHGR